MAQHGIAVRDAAAGEDVPADSWLHAAFEHAGVGIVLLDPAGLILRCNPAYAVITRRAREGLIGGTCLAFTHPDDVSAHHAVIARLRAQGGPVVFDERLLTPGGEPVPIRATLTDGGGGMVVAVVEDISDQVRAETTLAERTRELESLVRAAPAAIYVNDRKARRTVLSSAGVVQMLGYTQDDLDAMPPAALMERVHPDDIAIIEDKLARADAAPDGEVIEAEFRFRRKDGEYVLISDRFVVLARDADGSAARIMGVALDVTDRRAAEEALARSEARFRAVQEGSIDGLMVFRSVRDASGIITDFEWTFVNDAGARLLGRQREWFQGRRLLAELPGTRDEGFFDAYVQVVETGAPWTTERAYRRDGIDAYIRLVANRVDDGFAVSFADLTQRRAAEQALAASEERLRMGLEAGLMVAWEWDLTTGGSKRSGTTRLVFGSDTLDSESFLAAIHPDDRAGALAARDLALKQGSSYAIEFRFRRPDGLEVWIADRGQAVLDASGKVVRLVGIAQDITARKTAELALAESEQRLRQGLAAGRMVAWEQDLATGVARRTDNARELFGLDPTGINDYRPLIHPDDLPGVLALRDAALETGSDISIETRLCLPDGRELWVANQARILRDAEDRPVRIAGITQDITARKTAELAVAASEADARARSEELQAVLDAAPAAIWIAHDSECTLVTPNRFAADLIGSGLDANHGFNAGAMTPAPRFRQSRGGAEVDPADLPLQRACRGEEDTPQELTFEFDDGRRTTLFGVARPLLGPDGRPRGAVYAGIDVTPLKEIEERLEQTVDELRKATQRLDAILDNTRMAVFVMDDRQQCVFANAAAEGLTGYSFADLQGRPLHDVIHHKRPDGSDYPLHECPIDRAFPERAQTEGEELFVAPDGSFYPVAFTASPLMDAGRPVGTVIEARDITEERERKAELERLNRDLADQVAAAVAAREAALAQMHEMQKLETIGQLTGGIAHDFNNLLTPIVAGLDMLQRRYKDDERAARLLSGAQQSAERARVLVSRLLAFARRQMLDPRPVDLGELVAGMRDLIDRSLGPQIDVVVEVADALPAARVDSNQLELALLNLCVNARDAMPGGGKLTIAADVAGPDEVAGAGLPPGRYVRLCVTDTGVGMTAETMQRAIEPFYTTKGVGKGTGLGLSMVHGLAAQSGGALKLKSAPDEGTTVTIWLPVAATPASRPARAVTEDLPAAPPLSVLLVDDEELVREAAADMLDTLGHTVVQAGSPDAALAVLRSGAPVDLILTDYLMPGMTGADLVGVARTVRPGLPAALVTGFARLTDAEAAGLPRLQKPFTAAALARLIAELGVSPAAAR